MCRNYDTKISFVAYRGSNMAARILLVLAILVFFYGCGPPIIAPRPGEKEDVEKAVQDESEATPVPETTAETEAATVACSDFYGPQDAQAYFDSKANAAEKRSLNPDGDEWACNEGGVTFKPEPDITLANFGGLTDRESIGLLRCQMNEYAEDHGQEAADEYFGNKLGEERAQDENEMGDVGPDSVQEHFITDGYSCTWDEINATLVQLRQAASASASSSAP